MNVFISHQFGFRLNLSKNNVLMSTAGNIQSRQDDNEFAAGVLVDLKAH